jgi:hypothetical protein
MGDGDNRPKPALFAGINPWPASKGFQAGRKEIQASRKEIQARWKEIQARWKEIQVRWKEIQMTFLGFSMGYLDSGQRLATLSDHSLAPRFLYLLTLSR